MEPGIFTPFFNDDIGSTVTYDAQKHRGWAIVNVEKLIKDIRGKKIAAGKLPPLGNPGHKIPETKKLFTPEEIEEIAQEKKLYLRATNTFPMLWQKSYDDLFDEFGEPTQTRQNAKIIIDKYDLVGSPSELPPRYLGKWGIQYDGIHAKEYYEPFLMEPLKYLIILQGKYLGENVQKDGDIVEPQKFIAIFEKANGKYKQISLIPSSTIKELETLIDTVVQKGKLLYAGEAFGLGKTGDVNVSWTAKSAKDEIGFLLEEYPELINRVPKEIQLLIKGQAYEGIFEDLRKSAGQHKIPDNPGKEVWEMTEEEFAGIEPKSLAKPEGAKVFRIDYIIRGMEPPYPFGKVSKEIVANTKKEALSKITDKSPLSVAKVVELKGKTPEPTEYDIEAQAEWEGKINDHRVLVQRALSEGKPVPAEVLKDYPELGVHKIPS